MTTTSPEISTPDLHCPQCGYNLRGIESELCPECGLAIDRAAFAESQLPWSHRKRIGYVRAYLRTLAMGLLDSKKLAMEVARPVSFRDAQKFRFITVLIAWIPLAALAIWGRSQLLPPFQNFLKQGLLNIPEGFAFLWPWEVGAMTFGVAPLAIALFLIFMSGVASYHFHPKAVATQLQNRAIALSYYTCGPLLILSLAVVLLLTMSRIAQSFPNLHGGAWKIAVATGVISAALPIITFLGWWLTMLRLHRRVVHASGGGSVVLAITLPVAWIICAAFALVGVVWTIGFVELIIRSFV